MSNHYSPFLPSGYVIRNGSLYREICETTVLPDASGVDRVVEYVEYDRICDPEVFVTDFTSATFGLGFFTCYVGSRETGYKKHPLPYTMLAKGAAFSQWFATLDLPPSTKRECVRSYLMDCALPLFARAQELKRLEAAST